MTMTTPTHKQAMEMVYVPIGVKWQNSGEMVPVAEAVALGATNIRENPDVQSVGMVADWPQHYFAGKA